MPSAVENYKNGIRVDATFMITSIYIFTSCSGRLLLITLENDSYHAEWVDIFTNAAVKQKWILRDYGHFRSRINRTLNKNPLLTLKCHS